MFSEFISDFTIPHKPDRKALLAFGNTEEEISSRFIFLSNRESESDRRAGLSGYPELAEWYKILFELEDTNKAAVVSFHYSPVGNELQSFVDLALVDKEGEYVGECLDQEIIERARDSCLDLLHAKGFITGQLAAEIRATQNIMARNAALKNFSIEPDSLSRIEPVSNATGSNQKALIWLESSLTVFHITHMAQLSRALQARGIDVIVITSEDTIDRFQQNGGRLNAESYCAADSEINFGDRARFLPVLPSQKTYKQMGSPTVPKAYELFEFIGMPKIVEMRKKLISTAIEQEQPDIVITSLWPSGYGPFTPEIEHMISAAKAQKPAGLIYSLSSDIPYIDADFNHTAIKARQFDKVHRTFVRGDGSMPFFSSGFHKMSPAAIQNTRYVGHFIDPLPPRREMQEEDRKVLVTYGGRENNWRGGSEYGRYFSAIIKLAPDSCMVNHPWELVIGTECSDIDFESIRTEAQSVSVEYNMRINVRRATPDRAFRQEIADAAFHICDYDLFILDYVSTGIPTVATTGEIDKAVCGARDGHDRLENLEKIGAPLREIDQRQVESQPFIMVELIRAMSYAARKNPFSIPLDAASKVADEIVRDQVMLRKVARKYGFTNLVPSVSANKNGIPDPVIRSTKCVESQNSRTEIRQQIE